MAQYFPQVVCHILLMREPFCFIAPNRDSRDRVIGENSIGKKSLTADLSNEMALLMSHE